jgi:hypothetical protein
MRDRTPSNRHDQIPQRVAVSGPPDWLIGRESLTHVRGRSEDLPCRRRGDEQPACRRGGPHGCDRRRQVWRPGKPRAFAGENVEERPQCEVISHSGERDEQVSARSVRARSKLLLVPEVARLRLDRCRNSIFVESAAATRSELDPRHVPLVGRQIARAWSIPRCISTRASSQNCGSQRNAMTSNSVRPACSRRSMTGGRRRSHSLMS